MITVGSTNSGYHAQTRFAKCFSLQLCLVSLLGEEGVDPDVTGLGESGEGYMQVPRSLLTYMVLTGRVTLTWSYFPYRPLL